MSVEEAFWESWKNATVATRWGGEDYITVEDLYLAFKERLEAERKASASDTSAGVA